MLVLFINKIVAKLPKRKKKFTLKEEVPFIGLVLGILLALWSDEVTWYPFPSGRVNLNPSGKANQLSDRILKLDSKPRGVTDDKFFPNSKAPAVNFIDYDARTLYLLVRDDDAVDVRPGWTPGLVLNVVVPYHHTKYLDETVALKRLSRLLKVPKQCLFFYGMTRNPQPGFASLQAEICANTSLGGEFFIQRQMCFLEPLSMVELLKQSFMNGDLSYTFNSSVYAIEIFNRSIQSSHQENSRSKRQTSNDHSLVYLRPYRLIVCCVPKQIALEQPFSFNVTIVDYRGNTVEELPNDKMWMVRAMLTSWDPTSMGADTLSGAKEVQVAFGNAQFHDLVFLNTGRLYEISFVLLENGRSLDWVRSYTTHHLTVTERPLQLFPNPSGPPYSAIEGQPLLPYPEIFLIDLLTKTPVKNKDLKKYKWIGTISLKYDFYDCELLGEKQRENVGNRISFPELRISKWGLWFYLTVNVYSVPSSDRNYTIDIGPFEVRPRARNDEPIVTYTSKTSLVVHVEANFKDIQRDPFSFYVYFMNFFGRKYDKVSWLNVTAVPGSILATAEIMGSWKQLNETATTLAVDTEKGLDLMYIPDKPWRVRRAAAAENDKGDADSKKKKEGQGSLPLAWIAAIVINGVLVFLFILFVVYCYCRSKKRSQQPEQEDPYGRHYGSTNERSYNEKAASNPHQRGRMPGTERAALITTGAQRGVEPKSVFTIEDERRRLRDEEDLEDYEPDRYSSPIDQQNPNYNSRPGSRPISSPPYYFDDERDKLPAQVKTKGTVTDELDDDLEEEYKERLENYGGYVDDPRSPGAANLPDSVPTSPIHGFKSPSPTKVVRRTPTPPPPPPYPPQADSPVPEASRPPEHRVEETRSETRNLSREGFYYRDEMDMPAVNAVVPLPIPIPDPSEEAWQNPQKSEANVAPVEKPPQIFDVYLLKEGSGVKSKKGKIPLNLDAPMTLTHLRSLLSKCEDPKIKAATKKKYIFMTDDLRSVDLPEGALLVKNLYPSNSIYIQQVDDEWQAPKKKEKKNDPVEPQPIPKTYAVNVYKSDRGVKEFVGEISLPESGPLTLTHLRSMLCKAPLNIEGLAWKDYIFLSENLEDVSAPEGALLVDLLYPNQEIIFRLVGDNSENQTTNGTKKAKSQPPSGVPSPPKAVNTDSKRKDFAYVGPMGMCSAAECEKPARIKCLDCGQVGYCTTRHMRDDQFTHKRVCFKRQWKH